MPKFRYVATNDVGKTVRGTTFAETEEQAESDLRSQRLYDISVVLDGKGGGRKGRDGANGQVQTAEAVAYSSPPKVPGGRGVSASPGQPIQSPFQATGPGSYAPEAEAASEPNPKKSFWQIEITQQKVPKVDIMNFSRQLGAFIAAGIPILEAIDTFAEETGNKTFRRALIEIATDLRRGQTLSAAVAAHPKIFPQFYSDMLRAAELTGRLDAVLRQLSLYMERDLEARRKIRSATIYPAVIGVMSIVTVAILSIFVLPKFKVFFASFNAKLPLPTRIVLSGGQFVGRWWWALGAGALLLALGIFLILRSESGRLGKDKLLLKIPVIADVVKYAIVERFCRVLASMVRAGVPLPEAMVVVADGTRNQIYERALLRVRDAMLQGEGLAAPIQRTELFPVAVTQMVRVGEDTGSLDAQLETAAGFYQQELDYKIKKLTTLFEPAMIVFMGLIVGFVAVALISAMYGIYRQVNVP